MRMTDFTGDVPNKTARLRVKSLIGRMRRQAVAPSAVGGKEEEERLAVVTWRVGNRDLPSASEQQAHAEDTSGDEGLETRLLGSSMPSVAEIHAAAGLSMRVGRYLPIEELGRGGMGRVLRAYDPKLQREIALKVMNADIVDSHARARMVREARIMASLNHPNVVAVYDVEDDPQHGVVLAMELVKGTTLREWLREQPRRWDEILEAFVQAGRGLAAAHGEGLLHRDFKPANVLVAFDDHEGTHGHIKVTDFGIAKRGQERVATVTILPRPVEVSSYGDAVETLTEDGVVVGTPVYMAPEQHRGEPLTSAADQYAFCVALWEALYGERPFDGRTPLEIAANVVGGKLRPPPRGRAVPSRLRRACERGLLLDPQHRWPSMNALIAALQADPAKRRRRALWVAGPVVLTVLGTYGVVKGVTPDGDVCTGAAGRIHEVWDPTIKATIESAFEETHLPYARDAWMRVEQELDARTAAWVEHHTEVCEATSVRREQSPALMDVRMACLERRRGEIRALVEVFQMPDDSVVTEAVDAVQGLEGSEGCFTLLEDSGTTITDPAMRAKADEIENMLAQSKARDLSERSQSAIDLAAAALERARELGHRPTLARVAVHHARLRAARAIDADAEIVRDDLIEAIALASETDQPDLEVEGWAKLIVFDGVKRGQPEGGLALRIPAQMALREGGGIRSEATLEQAIGNVLHAKQDHKAALDAHIRALEKWKAAVGEQHTMVAAVLSNIGAENASLGRLEGARQYLEQAATMVESLYGSHHPLLGSIHTNLGGVLKAQGDIDGARAEYLAATELLQRALPSGHSRTLNAMLGLAQTEQVDDPARAERSFEDVLAMMQAQKKPDLVLMGSTYNSLGHLLRKRAKQAKQESDDLAAQAGQRKAFENLSAALETFGRLPSDSRPTAQLKMVELNFCILERDRGRLADAADHCNRAWALQEEQGPADAYGIQVLKNLADIELELGRRDEAIALLRKGIADRSPQLTATLRIDLAELLWGRDPARRAEAAELVRQAEQALRATPEPDKLAEVRHWLEQHPL
jgi:tRNA A-37 threonylcarbamoyl transferase component Bud32/tetratricopeptide (TPR) repeat protein